MTTKKGAAIAWWRHVVIRWWSCNCKCQWKLKLLLFLSVALTLFALFTFHSRHSPPDISFSSSSPSRHRLLRLKFDGVPKIAFLFLARRNLPLDFLWDSFFENADVANFSIYVHSAPGFVFNESTSRKRNEVIRSFVLIFSLVGWGESSMIQAERLLFDAALEDPANQRFILLSDSCVPLYNFSFIYNYVMASPRSFVDSFLDKKENRYNSKMSPVIPKEKWRKGSQWITLVRSHAEVIVDDEVILSAFKKFCKVCNCVLYMKNVKSFIPCCSFLDKKENRYNSKMSPVIPKEKWRKGSQWITLVRSHAEVIVDDEVILSAFKKFCKRRPPVDVKKGKLNIKLQKQHNCIPDEHYVQTLLAMSDLEGELERRTLTYTVWNQSATKMEHKGWHPFTFNFANAGPKQIKEIKDINHVYYETEFRTEWCRSNSALVPCFLFARKFSQGAAMRLLSDGVDINHVYYETEFRTEWCRSNSGLVPCFLFARKFSQGAAMRLLSDGVVGHADTSEV
ncbi:hypothetical protein CFP56_000367 [Quercus suber]|uniref:Core-2/I-branching beta-1,6-N-acetylglucosaminyltransferase family protein n=1 Tax=Quercus suber TaxID=58331 RepID=A0AAW0MBB8_QUESU